MADVRDNPHVSVGMIAEVMDDTGKTMGMARIMLVWWDAFLGDFIVEIECHKTFSQPVMRKVVLGKNVKRAAYTTKIMKDWLKKRVIKNDISQ